MDLVSDAIEVMRTGAPTVNRLQAPGPWRFRFAPYDGAGFHVLLKGSGWLVPEHGEPVALAPGDAILVPHGSAHVLSDAPTAVGARPFETLELPEAPMSIQDSVADFLCGKYRLDRTRTHPLLSGLPDVIHLPADLGRHPELRAAIDLLAREVNGQRPGRDSVVSGLLDVLLVYLTRAWLDEHAETGWPRALRDPEVAAALAALHDDPARPWRIEDLAAEVGLSRATLARRFTALTGQPPMAYLTWWRMILAAQLLRATDLPLPGIAHRVGYGSPFAFSHAFKREFGRAPGQYRSAAPLGSSA